MAERAWLLISGRRGRKFKWSRNLLKGKYTPLRIWQTILVLFVLATMIGSMLSGIILSRHVLSFLQISGGRALARKLHMLSAYWGFVLMSLHLGLHWSMIMGMAGGIFKKPSVARRWVGRLLAFVIAGYGVYAFGKREFGGYMLLRNQFVFFDFDEPILFFYLDYLNEHQGNFVILETDAGFLTGCKT